MQAIVSAGRNLPPVAKLELRDRTKISDLRAGEAP